MDLNTLWFILIGVLFAGFFFLEGFDYGVGMLLPFLGKDDRTRRVLINTVGPHWDGNEVWLITAGGALFAAFPHWYATMFSGFYMAFVLVLLALIVRGVAFEFRSKLESARWRNLWDWMLFTGSLLPSLLLPVALFNLLHGVPIDAKMTYQGSLVTLLNLPALVWGLAGVLGFLFHGAIFLSLKTGGEVAAQARATARELWPPTLVVLLVALIASVLTTDVATRWPAALFLLPLLAIVALGISGLSLQKSRFGVAFVAVGITILLVVSSLFLGLYPRVMVSSLNSDWSLTIYTASSSAYTLRIMSYIALALVPVVLLYQAWSYWVFRQRLVRESPLEY
ncbi:MAG: cytochrome d ubiquinol oxidase subunit II [Anaerolineae bacterium]